MRRSGRRFVARLALAAAVSTGAVAVGGAPAAAEPSTPAIWDNGTWWLRSSLTSGAATSVFRYGVGSGEFPVMGDWDGDGTETVGVARTGTNGTLTWYLRNSNTAGSSDVPPFTYGRVGFVAVDWLGTIPVAGDWDGDGRDTVGVVYYDPEIDGLTRWLLRNDNSTGSPDLSFTYSRGRDYPVTGDWDGDGTDTPGVFRQPNLWLLRNTNTGGVADLTVRFGASDPSIHELAVTGDWNGDGTDTPGVLRNRPATDPFGGFEHWLLTDSLSGGAATLDVIYGSDRFTLDPPIEFVPRLTFR